MRKEIWMRHPRETCKTKSNYMGDVCEGRGLSHLANGFIVSTFCCCWQSWHENEKRNTQISFIVSSCFPIKISIYRCWCMCFPPMSIFITQSVSMSNYRPPRNAHWHRIKFVLFIFFYPNITRRTRLHILQKPIFIAIRCFPSVLWKIIRICRAIVSRLSKYGVGLKWSLMC